MHYYRTGFDYRLTTGVKNLIIINTAIFILQLFLFKQLIELFGLTPVMVFERFMLWQIFTYMFLHGDIFHILFNMLALWMFGRSLEAIWGTKEFIKYYLLCGIGGGIATCLLTPDSAIHSIGASAGIFGILVAYGMNFPESIVLIFGLFPMKAKHFVILFGVIELLACMRYTGDGIAHFAHLGGMVVGYLYLKNILTWNWMTRAINELKKKRARKTRAKKEIELRLLKERVDVLLGKISSDGMESLSREEKAFLEKAGDFLRKYSDA